MLLSDFTVFRTASESTSKRAGYLVCSGRGSQKWQRPWFDWPKWMCRSKCCAVNSGKIWQDYFHRCQRLSLKPERSRRDTTNSTTLRARLGILDQSEHTVDPSKLSGITFEHNRTQNLQNEENRLVTCTGKSTQHLDVSSCLTPWDGFSRTENPLLS